MIKRLLTIRRFVLQGLCVVFSIIFAQPIYAQTYELNVGEKHTLPYPSPPAGYVDHIGTGRCTNKSDCIGVSGLEVYVYNYFTGTATVEIEYNYTYTGSDNRTHVGNATAYYSVKCKSTEVKLSKTTLELEPGDEVELSYTTNPSGLEPEVEWRTSDKSVASLSSKDEEYYHVEKISNQKKIKVCANTVGTCVIKLGCNTGYTAPTCSVTVKDDRPHLTASVASGPVKKGTKVILTCDRTGADIRYTTDKTDPTKNSQKYTSPIEINESMTIKARAYVNGEESRVLTLEYSVYAHMPGEVFTSKSVEGVDITYKVVVDGTSAILQVGEGEDKRPAISKSYTGKITIPNSVDNMNVRYIGKHAFYECNISDVIFTNWYSFTVCGNAFYGCKKLTSMKSSNYSRLKLESFAFNNCEALNTVIFYVQPLNNDYAFWWCDNIKTIYSYEKPEIIGVDAFDSKVYEEATLYVKSEYLNQYKNYRGGGWKKFKNIKAIGDETNKKLTLTASPSGGEVSKGTTVTLTAKVDGSTVSGCDIYYTLNGTTPTKSSTKYTSSGITINSDCTLKAIAYKNGYDDSDVLTEKYTIKSSTVEPTSIDVYPSSKTIKVGETITLTPTIAPINATTTLTWESSNTAVATVTQNGVVKGLKVGEAKITVTTHNGKSAYCYVKVADNVIYVTSISLNATSVTLTEGNTKQLEATVSPSNATNKTVTWSSGNTSVATVSSSGLVTAKSAGSATITCKAVDGSGKQATCSVTVKSSTVEPTGITISPSSKTITVGETFYASYTLTPSNATTTVTWSSDNTSIATVTQTGQVKGVGEGYTYINVKTANGKTARFKITVNAATVYVTSISLNTTSASLNVGETKQLSATVSPSNATNKDVTWNSSNTNVATVSSSGLVTAKSAGSATITCKAVDGSGKQATCSVTVKSSTVEPTGITISPSSKTITVGETFYASYTLTPSNATTTVTWSSDNTSIATVTQTGQVKGVGEGYTYINVKTANGKTSWFKITVNAATVYVTSISLNTTSASLNVGETKQLSATVSPSNATNKSLTWSSSNTNVATVSSSGLVTAKSTGSATITCKANDGSGVSESCYVKVSHSNIIEINSATFPDSNFRNWILEQDYGKDGKLTESEIKNVASINVRDKDITTLKGIEYFTSLTSLNCDLNQLTFLDVSKNTVLETLDCISNQLTSLDLSKNTALKNLSCNNNKLTSLDLSKNTALQILNCPINQLTSLDVSKNTALNDLYCPNNQLTSLDVSKNTALKRLSCNNNQLTSLDVSKNTALNHLQCYSNRLTSLDVSKNTALKRLLCNNNQLTSLDVSKNRALTALHCYDNKIKGEAMDALVGSLPNQSSADMRVIDLSNSSEENVCTTIQVNVAKGKGWRVLTSSGDDYEGSAPSGIQGITLDKIVNASIYDLNGRRLKKPSKGINIIDGKKVLKH